MSAHNPQVTYTLSDIQQQEKAIAALEAKSVEMAVRVQDYPNGDLNRIAALYDCKIILNEIEQACKDLETMRRGLRS